MESCRSGILHFFKSENSNYARVLSTHIPLYEKLLSFVQDPNHLPTTRKTSLYILLGFFSNDRAILGNALDVLEEETVFSSFLQVFSSLGMVGQYPVQEMILEIAFWICRGGKRRKKLAKSIGIIRNSLPPAFVNDILPSSPSTYSSHLRSVLTGVNEENPNLTSFPIKQVLHLTPSGEEEVPLGMMEYLDVGREAISFYLTPLSSDEVADDDEEEKVADQPTMLITLPYPTITNTLIMERAISARFTISRDIPQNLMNLFSDEIGKEAEEKGEVTLRIFFKGTPQTVRDFDSTFREFARSALIAENGVSEFPEPMVEGGEVTASKSSVVKSSGIRREEVEKMVEEEKRELESATTTPKRPKLKSKRKRNSSPPNQTIPSDNDGSSKALQNKKKRRSNKSEGLTSRNELRNPPRKSRKEEDTTSSSHPDDNNGTTSTIQRRTTRSQTKNESERRVRKGSKSKSKKKKVEEEEDEITDPSQTSHRTHNGNREEEEEDEDISELSNNQPINEELLSSILSKANGASRFQLSPSSSSSFEEDSEEEEGGGGMQLILSQIMTMQKTRSDAKKKRKRESASREAVGQIRDFLKQWESSCEGKIQEHMKGKIDKFGEVVEEVEELVRVGREMEDKMRILAPKIEKEKEKADSFLHSMTSFVSQSGGEEWKGVFEEVRRKREADLNSLATPIKDKRAKAKRRKSTKSSTAAKRGALLLQV